MTLLESGIKRGGKKKKEEQKGSKLVWIGRKAVKYFYQHIRLRHRYISHHKESSYPHKNTRIQEKQNKKKDKRNWKRNILNKSFEIDYNNKMQSL